LQIENDRIPDLEAQVTNYKLEKQTLIDENARLSKEIVQIREVSHQGEF
jgi:hypothetical protein